MRRPYLVTPHHTSSRKTIPAREVGVTLTIGEKALEEIDRIQGEAMRAALEGQRYFWR